MVFRSPADLVNRSLDALGAGYALGDIEEGSPEAEPARRAYGPTLRQLLRAAHWSFARKSASLQLLGDSSGNTLDPGTGQPISMNVELPWLYAYAWPIDGVAMRWVPWQLSPVNALPVPPVAGLPSTPNFAGLRPAKFLVSSSDQFPVTVGQVDWDNLPDLEGIEGVGPIGRRVVLSNVQNALGVYTRLVLSIEEWDPLFEETMVAVLAQRLALVAVKDRKEAIALRDKQILIAKDMLMEARARNANDSGFPQTLDHTPDWIRARRGAGRWGAGFGMADDGPGMWFCGWSGFSFADGSVF